MFKFEDFLEVSRLMNDKDMTLEDSLHLGLSVVIATMEQAMSSLEEEDIDEYIRQVTKLLGVNIASSKMNVLKERQCPEHYKKH